nr:hypothetical protein [Pandoravirus belohorizontensis]
MSAAHWFERARPLDPSQSVAVGPTTRPPDQLLNSNGARMCDALGCRRHVRLVQVHRGMFCRRHAAVAADLRARIAPHRGDAVEAEARVAEIVFRKRPDHGHVHYAVRLSNQTRWVDARAARDRGPTAVDVDVSRASTGLAQSAPPIGDAAGPRGLARPPASWFGPESDGAAGGPWPLPPPPSRQAAPSTTTAQHHLQASSAPAHRARADAVASASTMVTGPLQQTGHIDNRRPAFVGQTQGGAAGGPDNPKARGQPSDGAAAPMPRIACGVQSGWVPVSLVARSAQGPTMPHCPTRRPQHSASQSAVCVPAPLRQPTPAGAANLNLRFDKREHGTCHVAGCTKVPCVRIDGEGVFCKRHGRVAAAARSRAVALIGDVPFACATVMAGGANDKRARRSMGPRHPAAASRAWWPPSLP